MKQLTFILVIHCAAANVSAGDVDFDRDVRPILSEHCFQCHGPDAKKRETDLRLDTREGVLSDLGDYAAVVPGQPQHSELIRRINSQDEDERMPPPDAKLPLTPQQIETLHKWVQAGAPWEGHWAFQPVVRPEPPDVQPAASSADGQNADPASPRNAIDRFIFARLDQAGLKPSPEAPRETLIRRVTLDLTGLPPTPEEVDAFVGDQTPDAYEKVVDRLLESKHYGERMAWPWLDAARYADSNGYQQDRERTMYPWRDWVINAFNSNMPFDQFTVWQIAGDLLPEATDEQKLATGFCRNHMINGEGGRIAEENRIEYIFDQIETVSTVWLGVTMTCARCHDHKFDPLKQREYYSIFAYFNQTPVNGGGGDPQTAPVIQVPGPGNPKVMVMADMPKPRKTFVLAKGVYSQPGEEVTAALPDWLPASSADEPANRLQLARWLTAPDHPLTARVTVNRFWAQLFGTGIVKTSEDFGTQGERPSHPQLLDWLATEMVRSKWDVKHLMRLMVISATYRQSSRVTPELHERDPDNRLLARGPRYRMPSWMLRDQALHVSGLLVPELGGPPVKPYQPNDVWREFTFGKKKYVQDHGDALYRRSLYTFWRRIIGPTMFFDVATRQTCEVKSIRTNTPIHALVTLNDVTYVEAARAMAERVLSKATDEQRFDYAYRLLLARRPLDDERHVLERGIGRLRGQYADDVDAANTLLALGEAKRDESIDAAEHAAWTNLCLGLMNLDEGLTRE